MSDVPGRGVVAGGAWSAPRHCAPARCADGSSADPRRCRARRVAVLMRAELLALHRAAAHSRCCPIGRGWLRFPAWRSLPGAAGGDRPALNAARYGSPLASGYGSTGRAVLARARGAEPRAVSALAARDAHAVRRCSRCSRRGVLWRDARARALALVARRARSASRRDLSRLHRVRRLVVHPVSAAGAAGAARA